MNKMNVRLQNRSFVALLFLLEISNNVVLCESFSPSVEACELKGLMYSEKSNKCDVKLLDSCDYSDPEFYGCVDPNSECNYHYHPGYYAGFRYCVCLPHFTYYSQHPSGENLTCVPARSIGEPCKTQSLSFHLCDPDANLRCETNSSSSSTEIEFNGVCKCDEDASWNEETKVCVTTNCEDRDSGSNETFLAIEDDPSGPCHIKLGISTTSIWLTENLVQCPSSSHFRLNTEDGSYYENTNVRGGKCKCDPNFKDSTDGKLCLPIKSHQESCSTKLGDPCDPVIGLTCQNGGCECSEQAVWSNPDSLCYSDADCERRLPGSFYNAELKSCSLKIRSKCISGSNNPENKTVAICAKNSACLWRETCECNTGFFETIDRRSCEKPKSFGDSCSDEKDVCNPRSQLSCINGTCGCEGKSEWDVKRNDCLALAGGLCGESGGGKDCVGQAYCFPHNRLNYDYRKTCACYGGTMQTSDGYCKGKYLSDCENTESCMSGTVCIDKSCKCRNPTREIYDSSRFRCFGLVGSECSSNGTKCEFTSKCIDGVCQCEEGTSETLTRTCSKFLGFGAECGSSKIQCDFAQGLACIEGTCTCLDSYLTFVAGTGCVAGAGSPCGSFEPVRRCQAASDMERRNCPFYHVKCSAGLSCNPIGNGFTRCEQPSTSKNSASTQNR